MICSANRLIQLVSKLNKQNFDLKLELYQRRQRDEDIESQLKKMKKLEAEHAEVRRINDDLVRELELRDVAVKEAVAIICELEAKIEGAELQGHLMYTEVNETQNNTEPPSQDAKEPLRDPPPLQSSEDQISPLQRPQRSESYANQQTQSIGRTPSFLRDKKPSTSALRSIYQSDGNTSYISLNRAGSPIRANDLDSQSLNSPRLSMLSETSLLSVYDKLPRPFGTSDESEPALTDYKAPSRFTADESGTAKERRPTSSSIHQPDFVANHSSVQSSRGRANSTCETQHQNPVKHRRDTSSNSVSDHSFKDRLEHFSAGQSPNTPGSRDRETSRWLDQSMSGDETSPLQQRVRRKRPSKSGRKSLDAAGDGKFSTISEVLHETQGHKLERIPPLTSLGGSGFSGPNILPPTPDTMSTQKEANSSTQSIITEKSLGDKARFPARKVSAMIPDDRPHTAGTLNSEFEKYAEESDEERQSMKAPKSEAHTDAFVKESLQPSFPFMSGGSSPKTMQITSRTPTRPSLKTYATNIMFDGDGFDEVQPSRGMSYPSPKEPRRRSVAYTPARRDHARTASGQVHVIPNYVVDNSVTPIATSPTTTPSKPSPLKPSPLKPSNSHEPSIASSQGRDDETAASGIPTKSKIPRQSSIRQGFDNLKNFKNSIRRNLSYGGTTGVPLAAEVNNNTSKGTSTDQSPSRIARPGTSGEGSDGLRSFSGPKMARSASLRIRGQGGGGGKRG